MCLVIKISSWIYSFLIILSYFHKKLEWSAVNIQEKLQEVTIALRRKIQTKSRAGVYNFQNYIPPSPWGNNFWWIGKKRDIKRQVYSFFKILKTQNIIYFFNAKKWFYSKIYTPGGKITKKPPFTSFIWVLTQFKTRIFF